MTSHVNVWPGPGRRKSRDDETALLLLYLLYHILIIITNSSGLILRITSVVHNNISHPKEARERMGDVIVNNVQYTSLFVITALQDQSFLSHPQTTLLAVTVNLDLFPSPIPILYRNVRKTVIPCMTYHIEVIISPCALAHYLLETTCMFCSLEIITSTLRKFSF
jgi:hypothetical protein